MKFGRKFSNLIGNFLVQFDPSIEQVLSTGHTVNHSTCYNKTRTFNSESRIYQQCFAYDFNLGNLPSLKCNSAFVLDTSIRINVVRGYKFHMKTRAGLNQTIFEVLVTTVIA